MFKQGLSKQGRLIIPNYVHLRLSKACLSCPAHTSKTPFLGDGESRRGLVGPVLADIVEGVGAAVAEAAGRAAAVGVDGVARLPRAGLQPADAATARHY